MTAKEKYIVELEQALFFKGKNEKNFIIKIKQEINEEESYDDIMKTYGTPVDIADSFLEEYDYDQLFTLFGISRMIKREVILLLLILLIAIFILTHLGR